jgi:hypothetical protein
VLEAYRRLIEQVRRHPAQVETKDGSTSRAQSTVG